MQIDENVSGNGQSESLDVTSPLPEYKHSDWRTSCSETPEVDLSNESLEVQAAMKVLEGKHGSLYLDWIISDPSRRILCAREMAKIHNEIEAVLTSNSFRPQ